MGLQGLLQKCLIGLIGILAALAAPADAQGRDDLFASDRLARMAEDYRSGLIHDLGRDATDTSVLLLQASRAADGERWRVLRDNLEKLAARNPDSPATWLRLARAWRASDPANLRAAAASYRAYDIAATPEDRLDALFVMGDVVFEVWRRISAEDAAGAIDWRDTSKLIYAQIGRSVQDTREISVKLSEMNSVGLQVVSTDDLYPGLRDRKRVGDAPPPLCVTLSEPLIDDLDTLRDFVVVNAPELGQDAAREVVLRVAGAEICATGLRWGASYELTLKAGLPAKSGETLGSDWSISDRLPAAFPSVGFNTKDYILPQSGAGNITLASINVTHAEAKLYRLHDRKVLRVLAAGEIDRAYSYDDFKDVIDATSERIWSGHVPFAAEPNTEVITKIPAGRIIGMWETAARQGDATPPDAFFHGAFGLDISRPDNRGMLGPAAYAMVVDEVALIDTESVAERVGTEVQYLNDPLYRDVALQWMVRSDLGLTMFKSDRFVHVVVRHLSDGRAAAGATVELLATGGRVLGTAQADAHGTATFDRRLTRGADSNVFQSAAAYHEDDFGFLLANAEVLNLSELDIEGRIQSGLIDVFAVSERQIYRPDEVMSVLVLARDAEGGKLDNLPPLELKVVSDSGITAGRTLLEPGSDAWRENGRLTELKLVATAPIGPAELLVTLPGLDKPIARTPLQIRHFKPDRAKIRSEGDWTARGDGSTVTVAGAAISEYLFSLAALDESSGVTAPVRNKPVDAWVDVVEVASPHPGCYGDYTFGNDEESPPVLRRKVETLARTDDTGRIEIEASIQNVPPSSRPRAVSPSLYLLDDTGVIARLVDEARYPIVEQRNWIGIRQRPGTNPALTGALSFDVVSTDGANAPQLTNVEVRVERERTVYVWSGGETGWDYQRSVQTTPFASTVAILSGSNRDGSGCLNPSQIELSAPGNDALPLGSYRVQLVDAAGDVVTSMRFRVGAQTDPNSPEKPSQFPVRLSEGSVSPGDAVTLAATDLPFVDGQVLFALGHKGNVGAWVEAPIADGAAQTDFAVPEDWEGRFVHVFATAFGRSGPQAETVSRAVGLSSFRVEAEDRKLDVEVLSVEDVGSGQPAKVTVRVANPAPDEDTYAVFFAVDEGVHSITGYETPDPFEYFHGRQGFSFEIQDVYANLIKDLDAAMLGENGGDLFADFRGEGYDSQKLAIKIGGPQRLEDGVGEWTLDPLDFTGQVRIDAFAWSASRAGHGQWALRVFDALELSVAAPGHVHAGDRLSVPITLRNILQSSSDRFLMVASVNGAELSGGQRFFQKTLVVPETRAETAMLDLDIPADADGTVQVTVKVVDERGVMQGELVRQVEIKVRNTELPQTRLVRLDRIAPGDSRVISDSDLRARLGTVSRFDKSQVVFQAFPAGRMPRVEQMPDALLVNAGEERDIRSLASAGVMNLALSIDKNKAQDILALQTAEGGFMTSPVQTRVPVLAPGFGSGNVEPILDPLWRSAVALDFLQYAKLGGQEVPALGLDAAKGFLALNLRSYLDRTGDPPSVCRREVFFSALVLARANTIDRRSYERIKDRCQDYGMPPLDVALLSSFLLAYGDVDSANSLLALNFDGASPEDMAGTSLEDLAMSVALLAENRAEPKLLDSMSQTVAAKSGIGNADLDAQSASWIVRAEKSLSEVLGPPARVQLAALPQDIVQLNDATDTVWTTKAMALSQQIPSLELTNFGDTPVDLFAVVRLPRSVMRENATAEDSLILRRRVFNTAGEELLIGENFDLNQNEMAIFVIEGTLPDHLPGQSVRVVVPIPGGFDLEVTQLGADTLRGILGDRVTLEGTPLFVEAQPDRLLLVIDPDTARDYAQGRQFRYAFAARAVIAGSFTIPVSVAEVIDNPVVSGDSSLMRVDVAAAE